NHHVSIYNHETHEHTDIIPSTLEYEDFSTELLLGIPKSIFGPTPGWNLGAMSYIFGPPAGEIMPDSGMGYIHIPHRANWIQASTVSDTVGPGESRMISLVINAASLPLGESSALIHFINNDPEMRDLIIPINVDVLVGVVNGPELPAEYALWQNYPNPFNPTTTIKYELPETADVTLSIFDILGRSVWDYEKSSQEAGYYSLQWNGVDKVGRQVAAGMYFARLRASDYSSVVKMVYLR
ncbi:MAG: T9SS type A sorting domain-containing protein, partial [Candidatus Marinimicrobia bacterium]|nr:T9SS type A sorting domain-containing protein [Candidatus Neomarinimicrobiota bacterium]